MDKNDRKKIKGLTVSEYHKNYYKRNRKKYKPGIGITEIAIVKHTSKKTVYNNCHLFDEIPNTKPKRFYCNSKVLNWYPNYEMSRKKNK